MTNTIKIKSHNTLKLDFKSFDSFITKKPIDKT